MYRAFYFGFQLNGVPFSSLWLQYGGYSVDPNVISELTNKSQSICELEEVPFELGVSLTSNVSTDFFNLVMMQWFNLLCTRTRRLSIFQQNPIRGAKTRNLYLFPAMFLALGLGW